MNDSTLGQDADLIALERLAMAAMPDENPAVERHLIGGQCRVCGRRPGPDWDDCTKDHRCPSVQFDNRVKAKAAFKAACSPELILRLLKSRQPHVPIWRLWDEAEARKCKRVVAKWMWRAADGMNVCGQDTDGVLEWHERWEWWQDHNGHQSRLTPSHYFPLPVPPSLCLTKAEGSS